MSAKTTSYSKVTIRQPLKLKRRVEQAAARRGMTVTSFINSTLSRAADRTLEQARRRELSERDQRALLQLLTHPKGPNANLLRAAERYRERYGA
ncbi:MAG TPA: DUF1778 domain-containing protein [Phycisphaerae bacterium]